MGGEDLGVAGGGGGVAADHHNGARRHRDDGVKRRGVAPLARRIDDDDVWLRPLGGKMRGRLAGVHAEEIGSIGPKAQPRCRRFGRFDGLRHHLHPEQLAAVRQHRKPDRAHTAVEVEQKIARPQPGKFPRFGIERFGRRGVDLVKLVHSHRDRHAGQRIGNAAGAADGAGFGAQDHIGAGGVAVDEDRCQIKFFLKRLAQRGLARQPVAVHNKAEQPLPAVPALPHINMPQPAGVGFLVIGFDAGCFQQRAGPAGQGVHPVRLQTAAGLGQRHNAVAAPGVKPGDEMPVLIPPDRQLYLVAVAAGAGGGQRIGHRQIQPAQPAERVPHKTGLGRALGRVGQMAEMAAAAGPGDGAVRRAAAGAGGVHPHNPPVGIGFERLGDLHGQRVAGRGARHKDGLAVKMPHAVAVAGQRFNGEGDGLVFDKGHRGLLFSKLRVFFQRSQVLAGRHALDFFENA